MTNRYYLEAPDSPRSPEEVLILLAREFGSVTASREEADAADARQLELYLRFRPPDPSDPVQQRLAPGAALMIRAWDGPDPRSFIQLLAAPHGRLDLVYSKLIPGRQRPHLAKQRCQVRHSLRSAVHSRACAGGGSATIEV